MKFIEFKEIEEKVLYDTLENGLEVFILKKKGFNSYEARFFTNFGGIDIEFIPEGEKGFKKVPSGIAHFLEHKLFEQKSGEPVFEFYKKFGTYVNAFTNYKKTCYHINGINNFKENLNYLLDFVQEPYLTDKNIEKEKGIIIEEAQMNLDNPDRLFIEKINKNNFTDIPYENTVVGSIKDIKSITKEDLMKCYNTFYNPSNMKLMIVSPYDEKEVLEIVKNNQNKKKFKKHSEIIRKEYNEKEEVKVPYDVLKADIQEKRFCYSIKIKMSNFNANKIEIYDSIMTYLCFQIGSLSEFNLNLKKKQIVKGNISYAVDFEKDEFVFIHIYMTTEKEKECIELLEEELKKKTITEKDFNDFKKIIVSSTFYNLNTIGGTMNFLYNTYCFLGELNSKYFEIEKKLTFDKFNEIINKINLKNKSIVVLDKKD